MIFFRRSPGKPQLPWPVVSCEPRRPVATKISFHRSKYILPTLAPTAAPKPTTPAAPTAVVSAPTSAPAASAPTTAVRSPCGRSHLAAVNGRSIQYGSCRIANATRALVTAGAATSRPLPTQLSPASSICRAMRSSAAPGRRIVTTTFDAIEAGRSSRTPSTRSARPPCTIAAS